MTLRQLSERLADILRERPDYADKTVACRTTRTVEDKRTRSGTRQVESWGAVKYGCSGLITLPVADANGENTFVELMAKYLHETK